MRNSSIFGRVGKLLLQIQLILAICQKAGAYAQHEMCKSQQAFAAHIYPHARSRLCTANAI